MEAVLEKPQEGTPLVVKLGTKSLKQALDKLTRVVPGRPSNPTLAHVALTPTYGTLVLAASDGERDLELQIPADATPGPTRLVPAALFHRVAGSIAASEVTLTVTEDRLAVEGGGFQTELYLMEAGEELPLDFEGEPLLTAPANAIAGIFEQVLYAVSNEEYRAIFRGAQLEVHPDRLRAVASDGFRLALAERELPEGIVVTLPKEAEEAADTEDAEDTEGAEETQAAPEEPFAFVTPKRSLIELLRLLPPGGAPVELRHRRGRLVVVTEDVRYATALLEGVYPDYRRPIPDEFVAVAEVEAKPLREALRRVLVLADAANARVDLTFEEGRLRLVSEADYGRGEEVVELASYQGEPLTVVLNGRYLDDALQPVDATARLELSGPVSSMVVRDTGDAGYLAVVVPMRV